MRCQEFSVTEGQKTVGRMKSAPRGSGIENMNGTVKSQIFVSHPVCVTEQKQIAAAAARRFCGKTESVLYSLVRSVRDVCLHSVQICDHKLRYALLGGAYFIIKIVAVTRRGDKISAAEIRKTEIGKAVPEKDHIRVGVIGKSLFHKGGRAVSIGKNKDLKIARNLGEFTSVTHPIKLPFK